MTKTQDSGRWWYNEWLNLDDTDEDGHTSFKKIEEFIEMVESQTEKRVIERVRGEIIEMAEPYDGAKWRNMLYPQNILKLPSLTIEDNQ